MLSEYTVFKITAVELLCVQNNFTAQNVSPGYTLNTSSDQISAGVLKQFKQIFCTQGTSDVRATPEISSWLPFV
uniref:Uncharacterized protein n=1 Tax=Anguilla anguilla TaxID=7936 RepID=A0A0E9UT38_ANGAN